MQTGTDAREHRPGRPGKRASISGRLALPALAVFAGATAIVFVVFGADPTYDSLYAQVWTRDVWHGVTPDFDAYRAPTPHPLALLLALVVSPLGSHAVNAWLLMMLVAFVLLLCAVYRLGKVLSATIGLIAASLVATRPDVFRLALEGSQDMPYMALVVWAAALEAAKPRRGGLVWVLLVGAGLLRPEAWLLTGLYALWLFPVSTWRDRMSHAAFVVAAPVIWMAMDFAVTGAPLHSFQHTTDLAGELGKQESTADAAVAAVLSMGRWVKPLEFLLALVGVVVVLRHARVGQTRVPVVLVVAGLATYLLLALTGFSVIPRYLSTAAVGVLIFSAAALGGFTLVDHISARTTRIWVATACVCVLAGLGYMGWRGSLDEAVRAAVLRADVQDDLAALLADERVETARSCGPVTVPNHNMVPFVRWTLDAREDTVRARTAHTPGRGLHIIVRGEALESDFDPIRGNDPASVQVPDASWEAVARNASFVAYSSC